MTNNTAAMPDYSHKDSWCENPDCVPQENNGKLPNKKDLKEHPMSSCDIEELGTIIADILLPVPGLTI
eukprot:14544033-Ditylum_brightwellii.AAC.1